MARQARNPYDGVIYHVMQRGNNKRLLFKKRWDFVKFIRLLRKYKRKYSFELFNYCLMPNHIHLLMRLVKGDHASKLFQGIFQSFQYHHRAEYGYIGFLYQNRYKSIPVEKESYLLECARYIERNPLRYTGIDSLEEYNWSSYSYYINNKKNSLITPNPMYLDMAKSPKIRQRYYKEFLCAGRPYDELIDKYFEKMR